jgi:hypothetical protein
MHHHARRVDIGEFEGRALGATHARAIEGHENSGVEGDRRGIDQAGDLFRAPDDGEVNLLLRVGHFVAGPRPLESLEEEEAQRTDPLIDGVVGELTVTEQVSGVLADLFRPELIGLTVEITREVPDDSQVSAHGTFSVVTTRDFIERHFSKLGHRDLLVI